MQTSVNVPMSSLIIIALRKRALGPLVDITVLVFTVLPDTRSVEARLLPMQSAAMDT